MREKTVDEFRDDVFLVLDCKASVVADGYTISARCAKDLMD